MQCNPRAAIVMDDLASMGPWRPADDRGAWRSGGEAIGRGFDPEMFRIPAETDHQHRSGGRGAIWPERAFRALMNIFGAATELADRCHPNRHATVAEVSRYGCS